MRGDLWGGSISPAPSNRRLAPLRHAGLDPASRRPTAVNPACSGMTYRDDPVRGSETVLSGRPENRL